jgi:RNA polymerase sigma-70 factor (ECF subfamily)
MEWTTSVPRHGINNVLCPNLESQRRSSAGIRARPTGESRGCRCLRRAGRLSSPPIPPSCPRHRRQPGDAEDVVQEAFVSAWRSLRRLREPEKFDAWFGRILVNTARSHIRRRGTVTPISIDRRRADSPDDEHEHPGRHDPALDRVDSSDALARAIDRLSVDQRTILALHHLEERPVAQIAAVLGIPVGTAKWRLHAARQALGRALEAQR